MFLEIVQIGWNLLSFPCSNLLVDTVLIIIYNYEEKQLLNVCVYTEIFLSQSRAALLGGEFENTRCIQRS
jgi:hypothetical protein